MMWELVAHILVIRVCLVVRLEAKVMVKLFLRFPSVVFSAFCVGLVVRA